MSLRTDRVRAIGIFKARATLTPEQLRELAMKNVAVLKQLPIIEENLLKYEVSFKTEQPSGTLASEIGLRETDFSIMILIEAVSHDKIRATLTHESYRKLLAGALEHITTLEDFHFFPAEFVTVLDN
ncbi:hypothetical protein C8F04DRAFT_1233152 [Mycena alexandri]|uniref:Stress-response A/B barrel domain-containing protein n=1 Tax=Mycena alexandri TaxID=1745969 RepID=A0AAD6T2Y8_9AGAR|nr:hypothetical protein C8F04DRAFT_1240074 [Mycena alexandri]KAJ7036372.1 hypothetical protein C8F04DRAFT_1233152 [Mycena alexandri]